MAATTCQRIGGCISPVRESCALKSTAKKLIKDKLIKQWDTQLDHLNVQSKFWYIDALELNCPLWNWIISGLPSCQLSFIHRVGSDTLPTPLNLACRKVQTDRKCSLCNLPNPTALHILNSCPTSLNQGRYTWRHDSKLAHIVTFTN